MANEVETAELKSEEVVQQFEREKSAILARFKNDDEVMFLFSMAGMLETGVWENGEELWSRIVKVLLEALNLARTGGDRSELRLKIASLIAECRKWVE